jgi:hypothetical protein
MEQQLLLGVSVLSFLVGLGGLVYRHCPWLQRLGRTSRQP